MTHLQPSYRPHPKDGGGGKVMFSVCSQGGGGDIPQGTYPTGQSTYTPSHVRMGVSQGTYPLAKVPTPPPARSGQEGWGTLRYLPPWPRYLPPTWPGQDGRRGYPKVPTSPRIGQHMKYLISCGRYTSCVHTGGLSC